VINHFTHPFRGRRINASATRADIDACMRKIRHRTEERALVRAARCAGKYNARALRVYRCPACNGWHLTSKVRNG